MGATLVELDRNVKPATVKKEMAFLARLSDVAIKSWGYRLPFGIPARGVGRPSEGDGRERRLLPGDGGGLLAASNPAAPRPARRGPARPAPPAAGRSAHRQPQGGGVIVSGGAATVDSCNTNGHQAGVAHAAHHRAPLLHD
mgnify:CR=1 FL=1